MKSKWIWIGILVVLVVVFGSIVGVRQWMTRPGIHQFAGDVYVDLRGVGFCFDEKTGELKSEASVVIDGWTDGDEYFRGDLSVSSFPITEGGTIEGDAVLFEAGNGFYYIEYAPRCTHMETVPDGDRQYPLEHDCNYSYTYCIYPEDPSFMAVLVHDFTKQVWHTVIVADSEAQARERLAWFEANEPSLYE